MGLDGFLICQKRVLSLAMRWPRINMTFLKGLRPRVIPVSLWPRLFPRHRTLTLSIRLSLEIWATPRVMLHNSMEGEFNRWFGIQGIEMVRGAHTIKIPFKPDQWLSVFGKKGNYNAAVTKRFREFLVKPLNVCVVFGGGSFYGHGLFMSSGSATFRLSKLVI